MLKQELLNIAAISLWAGLWLLFFWLLLSMVVQLVGQLSAIVEDKRHAILGALRLFWLLPMQIALLLLVLSLFLD